VGGVIGAGLVPGRAAAAGEGQAAYWEVGSDGGVFSFGSAGFYGSMGGHRLAAPVVGIAPTSDGRGYWLVASDGGVFAFGDAAFHGSMGATHLNQPVVGIAPTPSGGGYWEVASDGGVFAFGDAGFAGSLGGIALVRPVVAIASTSDGRGYWMVGSDGGVFGFGDASYRGSLPARGVAVGNVVAIVPTPDGGGYWLVSSDGTAWAFGDAGPLRSLGALGVHTQDVSGAAPTGDAAGVWLVGSDGGVFGLGDAPFAGSLPALGVAVGDIVAMASGPTSGSSPPTAPAHGFRWSPPTMFDPAAVGASSVSCPVPTFCAVVDGGNDVWTWNGSIDATGSSGANGAWSGPTSLPLDTLEGVSCATAAFCVAVGSTTSGGVTSTAAVTYDGSTWAAAPAFAAVASQGGLRAASCPTATFCVAVGDQVVAGNSDGTLVERYDGTGWSRAVTPDPNTGAASGYALVGVSCPASSWCGAIGAYQKGPDVFSFVEDFDRTTWTLASTPDLTANDALAGVSCVAATSCVAVGSATFPTTSTPPTGLVDVFDGTTWAVSPGAPAEPLWAVVCTTANDCAAGGPGGNVLSDDGGTWSSPQQVDGPNIVTSVSCPTSAFCVATDNAGNALSRTRG
jgi:hypothetical protein